MRVPHHPHHRTESPLSAPPDVVGKPPCSLVVSFCTTVTELGLEGRAHSSGFSVDGEGRSAWKRAISALQSRTEKALRGLFCACKLALCHSLREESGF